MMTAMDYTGATLKWAGSGCPAVSISHASTDVNNQMGSYLKLLRPADWFKNVFVFAGLAFGRKIGDPEAMLHALYAFAGFCLASSAGYIVNDIVDRHRDRLHPVKKHRPIASGIISPPKGIAIAVLLLILTVGFCLLLPVRFAATVGSYFALVLLYSFALKQRMLLDVITIAVLFVLRAMGGAYAVSVEASPWLLVCTFMLCLFLGFGKRRCEIAMIQSDQDKHGHRATLLRYTPDLLNHLLSTSAGVAIITFVLYVLDQGMENPFGERKTRLLYTLPLVVYAIYRYAMLIELGKATGPTDLIAKDPPFLASLLLWGIMAVLILYGWPLSG